jgi:hypothetical protein
MHAATAAAPATIDVLDPAPGEPIATIPAGDESFAEAVRAARAAQRAWARRPAGERGAILKEAARRAAAHAEELAELQSRENGRPLEESRGGVDAGIGAIEQYAELGPLHRGRALNGNRGASDLMVHEPRGVAALLVPWNDPIAIACRQLAACLAPGNTVVLKPSERTPLAPQAPPHPLLGRPRERVQGRYRIPAPTLHSTWPGARRDRGARTLPPSMPITPRRVGRGVASGGAQARATPAPAGADPPLAPSTHHRPIWRRDLAERSRPAQPFDESHTE